MKFFYVWTLTALTCIHVTNAQYLVSPPDGGTAAPGASTDCSAWVQQSYDLTCAGIEAYFDITLADFEAWNPITTELGSGCNLIADLYYCVAINFTPLTTPGLNTSSSTLTSTSTSVLSTSTPRITTTTTLKTSTTSSAFPTSTTPACTAGVTLVSPTPNGMVCGVQGDSATSSLVIAYTSGSPFVLSIQACGAQCIATSTCTNVYFVAGASCNLHSGPISYVENNSGTNAFAIYDVRCFSDTYLAPSPPIGAVCDLQADAAARTGTGLLVAYTGTSGSPFVTSIQACANKCFSTATCTNVYFVNGTSCNLHYGVTSYVSNTNGVNAYSLYELSCFDTCPFPTPYQAGMAKNCNKFHYVVANDQCGNIATMAGVSLANFYTWNPAVGSSCGTLELGDYVCIGIS